MRMCVYACNSLCLHQCTYTHTCMGVYVSVYVHISVHLCVHVASRHACVCVYIIICISVYRLSYKLTLSNGSKIPGSAASILIPYPGQELQSFHSCDMFSYRSDRITNDDSCWLQCVKQ